MKPEFALNLSHDGLVLLHRVKEGWHPIGNVDLDDAAFVQELAMLRQTGCDLAKERFATKLIIPNSQILYRKLQLDEPADALSDTVIRDALDGTTPYPIAELSFDWVVDADGSVCVAAVAQKTLDEAESFAGEHDFNPVSFVAIPQDGAFDGEPFFGQTGLSKKLLGRRVSVERDKTALAIVTPTPPATEPQEPETTLVETAEIEKIPPAPPQNVAMPEPQVSEDTEPTIEPAQEPFTLEGAFSTRRLGDESPALIEPSLQSPRARFALYPESRDPDLEPLADIGLGETKKPTPDITTAGITARSLPGEKRPVQKKKKHHPKRQNPPRVQTATKVQAPPKPPPELTFSSQRAAQSETNPPRSKPLDGPDLTVFGARRIDADRMTLQATGILAGMILVATVALIALIWVFFPRGETVETAGISPETAVVVDDQVEVVPDADITADPAVTIVETNSLPTSETDQITALPSETPTPEIDQSDGINLASLGNPDQTDLLPTDLNDAERAESGGLEGQELTPEIARQIHAETGAWPLSPVPPVDLDTGRADDIYIASIDRNILSQDAIALPTGRGVVEDVALGNILSPPPPGTRFDFDERGFVRALPEGAVNPEGIQIYLGSPSIIPSLRPGSGEPPVTEQTEPDGAILEIPVIRPIARPENLIEIDEKARFGGRTLSQLAAIRPTLRPDSPQDGDANRDLTPTDLAVLTSRAPVTRPSGFSSKVEKALAEALANAPDNATIASASSVAAASRPSIPTRASVARAATTKNAINLSHLNLIGIYGSSTDRRALVRLKSGRYVKVQVGDRLDGGQVASISANRLQYIKRGQTVTLEIAT